MHVHSVVPSRLIIDIHEVLRNFKEKDQLYMLYNVFPLQDIVQTILSVHSYGDDGEFFWMELDRRLAERNNDTDFDFNSLSLFQEFLTQYLDESIRQKVPTEIDTGYYIFDRWVGPTTLIMQLDENVRSCRSFVQAEFS